jgi:hypothetical protein
MPTSGRGTGRCRRRPAAATPGGAGRRTSATQVGSYQHTARHQLACSRTTHGGRTLSGCFARQQLLQDARSGGRAADNLQQNLEPNSSGVPFLSSACSGASCSVDAHGRWYEGVEDGRRLRRRDAREGSLVPPEVDFEAKAQDVPPEYRCASSCKRSILCRITGADVVSTHEGGSSDAAACVMSWTLQFEAS